MLLKTKINCTFPCQVSLAGEGQEEKMDEKLIVPISAIEHYSYCPRQCGLILLEQVFEDNIYTLRGRFIHERAHSGVMERHGDVTIERSVRIWSESLGIVGKADVVEFKNGIPYPIEYKSGAIGPWQHAALQVCAQGMCFEEMMGIKVNEGAIYYHNSRRRKRVIFTPSLRKQVEKIIKRIREILRYGVLPRPTPGPRCNKCSLLELCMPWAEENLKQRTQHLFSLEDT